MQPIHLKSEIRVHIKEVIGYDLDDAISFFEAREDYQVGEKRDEK